MNERWINSQVVSEKYLPMFHHQLMASSGNAGNGNTMSSPPESTGLILCTKGLNFTNIAGETGGNQNRDSMSGLYKDNKDMR